MRVKTSWRHSASILVFSGTGLAVANPSPFSLWLNKNLLKQISITGNRTLGFHVDSVQGDKSAFDTLTNYGQGGKTFTDLGNLTINGSRVFGVVNFNIQYADSRYQDPLSSRFSIDYAKNGLTVDAGNISGSLLNSNRFLAFSRQMWGLGAGYTSGRMTFKGLHSTIKSSTQTFSFSGNNSSGPYYLQAGQIIADSVRVQVDGQELAYPDDFTVDTIVGSITFTKRSIAPTSTIVVSYETTGVNTGGGGMDGAGMAYDFGKLGVLGLTYAHQSDPLGGGLKQVDDRFQGYGDPSIPYFLQYVPLAAAPVIVRVDGIVQSPSVDYFFSTTNPTVFYFRRAIPTTSTVDVLYTPSPTGSLRGDRTGYGFDYGLRFGKGGKDGEIHYSQAFGSLSNAATPLSGLARGLDFSYRWKGYKLTSELQDIPDGFVGIDSTGFLRNQKSSQVAIDYLKGPLGYGFSTNNAAVAVRDTTNSGQIAFSQSRSIRDDGYLRYGTETGGQWTLDQQHLASTGSGGDSRADVTELDFNHPFGKLGWRMGLNRTQGYGPISNGISTFNGTVSMNSLTSSADYTAGRGLTFATSAGLSAINTAGQSGQGTDLSLSGLYRNPKGTFTFSSGYDYSNSGEIATLGTFANGIGVGYNGNGFSGGYTGSAYSPSGSGFNQGGTNLRRWQTTAAWQTNKSLAVSGTFSSTSQSGSVTTNSNSTAFGLNLSWALPHLHKTDFGHLDMSLARSSTSFLGTTGATDATTLYLALNGHPKGPWSYRLAAGTLVSGGNSYAQNSVNWEGSFRHFLHSNQALGVDFSVGSLTGYQAQSTSYLSGLYQYQIFKNVALVGRYTIRNVQNLDANLQSGAYIARGFDLELTFNFGY